MRRSREVVWVTIAVVLVLGALGFAASWGSPVQVRGSFVKLVEQQVGEREYLGIVVKPFESDDHRVVLAPVDRREMTEAVRRLRPGMKLVLGCVRDGGRDWVRSLDATWGEGDEGGRREERMVLRIEREGVRSEREVAREPVRREGVRQRSPEEIARERARRVEVAHPERREGEVREGLAGRIERLVGQFRELAAQVARMEREIRALRAENERLRGMLGERGEREARRDGERRIEGEVRRERESERTRAERGDRPEAREREGDRERPAVREGDRGRSAARGREGDRAALPRLPDSLSGFQGVLRGEIVRKLDRGFVLRLREVARVWDGNKAENPREAIGRTVVVTIRAEEGAGRRFLGTLRELEIGQKVLVEALHFGGEQLTVVEQLHAVD